MDHLAVSFHRSISLGSSGRLKSLAMLSKNVRFGKSDPLREDFENFVPKGFTTSQIHVLCANFVKFGRPEIGKSCVMYRTKKLKSARSRFCADRAQNLPGAAANNVRTVSQI